MDDRSVAYSDRRWYDDPGATVVLCSTCRRFLFDGENLVCPEYPDGIPEDRLDLIAGKDDAPDCYISPEA